MNPPHRLGPPNPSSLWGDSKRPERRPSGRLAEEAVAHTAHGLDQSFVTARGEHLPHSANVDVHGALLDENMVPPDFVEKLGAAVDPIGVSHEEMQQAKLGGLEIDFLAVAGDPVRGRVKSQAGDLDDLVASRGARRRITALIRASSSRGEKGLVM